MTTNSKNTTNSYYFDPETHVSTGPISNFGSVQTLGNQVVTLTSSLVAFFGGFDDVAYSKHWAYFRGSDLSLVGASTQLLEPRYTPTQYRLPDGRVFLVGGVGPADPMTIEEFVPSGVADTSGTFVHLRRSILGPDCVASTDPNCVRLSPSRSSSQFSSFQILGSSTWINGAVVVVGPVPPGHGSEIFIPAYDCAGSRPVKAGYGTEIGDVDFCDRNRGRQALTDPASP